MYHDHQRGCQLCQIAESIHKTPPFLVFAQHKHIIKHGTRKLYKLHIFRKKCLLKIYSEENDQTTYTCLEALFCFQQKHTVITNYKLECIGTFGIDQCPLECFYNQDVGHKIRTGAHLLYCLELCQIFANTVIYTHYQIINISEIFFSTNLD